MLIFKPHGVSLLDHETSWGFCVNYPERFSRDPRKLIELLILNIRAGIMLIFKPHGVSLLAYETS